MMSLNMIEILSKQAATRAAELKHEPLIAFTDGDIVIADIPNLGSYTPKGWDLVETYFVDYSGFGAEDEPALTVEGFRAKTKAGFGYAIVEEGPFQIYIGEFSNE